MARTTLTGCIAALSVLAFCAPAFAQQQVKPYIHVIVDTSGSMDSAAGCGGCGSRMEEVNAALRDIFSGISEVTFGLQSFIDTNKAEWDTCTSCPCDGSNRFCASGDVLVDFDDSTPAPDSTPDALYEWVDGVCATGGDPELDAYGGGNTPIEGNLEGALAHMTTVVAGDEKRECRPYVVVFMTDGEENCDAANCSGSVTAVSNLCSVPASGRPAGCTVKTFMIGLPGANLTCLDSIQDMASTGRDDAIVATDRTDLALAFQQIVADSVLIEVCDEMEDEDCDGNVDEGFQLYCDIPNGITDNVLCDDPGDPCDGVDDNCFAGITDEVRNACGTCGPAPDEVCDELDNDCDGFIDENLGCTPTCTPTGAEVCNTLDDDCNGFIDEADPMAGSLCGTEEGTCTPGRLRCINGELQCVGGMQPRSEVCDGLDNDCDGEPDNDAECPPMTVCIDAACRPPCNPDEEFPCPVGLSCEEHTDGNFYCIPSACAECGPGERCDDRSCVDLCEDVECEGDETCKDGECVGCAVGGCPTGEICVMDACIEDPCLGVDCDAGEACRDGSCVTPCDSAECPEGESCQPDWTCAADACAATRCETGEACVDGECVEDTCLNTACNDVEVCIVGEGCVPDPCLTVQCPQGSCETGVAGVPVCQDGGGDGDGDDGSSPGDPDGDGADLDPGHLIASGGGGCTCRAAGGSGSDAWPLLLAMLLLWRRRR